MAPSEAQKRAAAKWTKENMATLACKVKKEEAAAFKEYSEKQGKTSNTVLKEFVIQCIDEQIQRNSSNKIINEEKISTVENSSTAASNNISDQSIKNIDVLVQNTSITKEKSHKDLSKSPDNDIFLKK